MVLRYIKGTSSEYGMLSQQGFIELWNFVSSPPLEKGEATGPLAIPGDECQNIY
jgi:hypothetical protein